MKIRGAKYVPLENENRKKVEKYWLVSGRHWRETED